MKILILDTSSQQSFLLLASELQAVAYLPLPSGPALSKTIACELKTLLERHQFIPEAIAVGQGPGSYTGIRVGASLAQSLSLGWGVPLTGLCSLQFFVPEEPEPLLILAPAKGEEVHALEVGAETPRLLSLQHIPPDLRLTSPHPAALRHRLPSANPWVDAKPNIERAIREAKARLDMHPVPPLVLSY